jgi:hypothetical protein
VLVWRTELTFEADFLCKLTHAPQRRDHFMRDKAGHQVDSIVFFLKANIVLNFRNVGPNHHPTLLGVKHYFILSYLEK